MNITYTIERVVAWTDFIRGNEALPEASGFYLLFSPNFLHKYYVGMSQNLRARMAQRASTLHHVGVTDEMLQGFQILLVSCNVTEGGGGLVNINLVEPLQQNFHVIEGQHVDGINDPNVNLENVLIIVCDNALHVNNDALRNLGLPDEITAPNAGLNIQVNNRSGINIPFIGLPFAVNVEGGALLRYGN